MANSTFPKRTEAQATGELGVSIFSALVQREFGWDFRRTPQESDYGIDGYIDIVTPEGFVTGKSIAVQIKTGSSYFEEVSDNGWTYRGDFKHINYYLNLPTPVLLVLVSPNTQTAWWALFDPNCTTRTSSAWKLRIPKLQTFDASQRDTLQSLVGDATDYIPHLEHFWMENEQIKDAELICIMVSHDEIQQCDVEPFAQLFERLQVSRELIISAQNKVDFLICGYDSDTRELYEIPEVRTWQRKALERVKYFAYFLELESHSQGMSILQACVSNFRRKAANRIEFDPNEFIAFMNQQFDWLNKFTDQHDLGTPVNYEISMKLKEKLQTGIRFPESDT